VASGRRISFFRSLPRQIFSRYLLAQSQITNCQWVKSH
jgi:hypothetical protein